MNPLSRLVFTTISHLFDLIDDELPMLDAVQLYGRIEDAARERRHATLDELRRSGEES